MLGKHNTVAFIQRRNPGTVSEFGVNKQNAASVRDL